MKNKDKKLRLLISSNAIWSQSGYAMQAIQFVPKMAEEGYPTSMVNFYGQEGGSFEHKGITMFPKRQSTWGEDSALYHGKIFKADVVITLQDIWTLDPNIMAQMAKDKIRWIPIVPIDHEPVPPAIYDRLKGAYRIITYSKFGYEELKRVGMHSTYIPHTIETELFKPVTLEEKRKIRKDSGIPEDCFLFGMVAANKDNPPRKSFQEVLDAFKMFADKHDDAYIYFHTVHNQQNGFPILEYAKFIGVADRIITCNPDDYLFNIKHEDVPKVYNAMDCLLSPSRNEGFGVPIIEAQSCGVPAIVSDFTAMKDLVIEGKTGYKVKPLYRHFSPLLAYVAIPDVKELYEKMELVYKADRKQMSKDARKHIQEEYDFTKIWETRWIPFLKLLEDEVYA